METILMSETITTKTTVVSTQPVELSVEVPNGVEGSPSISGAALRPQVEPTVESKSVEFVTALPAAPVGAAGPVEDVWVPGMKPGKAGLLTGSKTAYAPSGMLIEDVRYVQLQIVESIKGPDGQPLRIRVRGEFGRVDVATENGRIYPRHLIEREIARLKNDLEARKLRGMGTHPADGRSDLLKSTHVITKLEITPEGIVIGEAEVLDTHDGKNIKALLVANCSVGVSSRGYGSTKSNMSGQEIVQDDYRLVTYDFVSDPADIKAYPQVFFEEKHNMTENEMAPDVLKAIEEARVQEREKLKDAFTKEMVDQISKLKVEMREQIRSEMLSDPEVAQAKAALDAIKPLLRPFILPEDTEAVLKSHETDKAKLRAKIAEGDLKIANLEEERNKLSAVSKEIGYKYFLEMKITNDPDSAIIRKLIGNVTSYQNSKEIDAKVTAIKAELTEQRNKKVQAERQLQEQAANSARLLQEEKDRAEASRRELQAMIAAEQKTILDKNKQLAEALEKSLFANKKLMLREHMNRKLTNNPKAAKIRSVIESSNVEKAEEIDQIIESFREPARDAADMEQVRSQVRKLTKGGYGSTPAEEETPRARIEESNSNGTNLSVDDFRKLSGFSGK